MQILENFGLLNLMFPSSIEHGGTRPFSNIMAPLTLFNEAPQRKSIAPLALKNAYLWLRCPSLMRGYKTIFQYVAFLCYYTLVFLCGTSCGGGFYMVPLAYDSGMGFPAPPERHRPEDTEQMSESCRFLRKQEKRRAKSDKRSVLLTAGGVRFFSKERSDVARNRAMGVQGGY